MLTKCKEAKKQIISLERSKRKLNGSRFVSFLLQRETISLAKPAHPV